MTANAIVIANPPEIALGIELIRFFGPLVVALAAVWLGHHLNDGVRKKRETADQTAVAVLAVAALERSAEICQFKIFNLQPGGSAINLLNESRYGNPAKLSTGLISEMKKLPVIYQAKFLGLETLGLKMQREFEHGGGAFNHHDLSNRLIGIGIYCLNLQSELRRDFNLPADNVADHENLHNWFSSRFCTDTDL